MSLRIQIVSILIAIGLFAFVFDLVRRKKLAEEYSVFWLAACCGVVLIAVWKELFFRIAQLLGIANPVSLIVLLLAVAFIIFAIHLSVRVSMLMEQNRELVQWIGLLRHRIEGIDGPPPGRIRKPGHRSA